MTFAITKFIYPLEKEIVLSNHLNYRLDNPRTIDEIKLVKNFISETLKEVDTDEPRLIMSLISRFGLCINDLKEYLEKENSDEYPLRYYNSRVNKKIRDIIAETWIILRFPDEPEFNKIQNNRIELFDVILSKKESIYSKAFKNVAGYCHLISLLSNNESDYYGDSFFLSRDPYDIFLKVKNQYVHEAIETFIGSVTILKYTNRAKDRLFWIDCNERILKEASKLEAILPIKNPIKGNKKIMISQKQSPKQKLIHIGNLLKTAYDHLKDPELILLLLVSIIEYLVIRNPDTSKFNVEDSISKQFKLKCAILIHNQDESYNLQKLNQELIRIYDQRSDLAHGNYRDKYNPDEIIDSVSLLYKFINHILNAYIKDRDLVDYLKDN